jgi:hypothetical protein
MPPAYVKRHKNDAANTEAICEAVCVCVCVPKIRFYNIGDEGRLGTSVVSGAFPQRRPHHKKLISRPRLRVVETPPLELRRSGGFSYRRLPYPGATFVMLEIAIILILGFALGYGVREWALRQSHRAGQRRRRPF